jgi:PTS system nitrogen regulatory IIA component
MNLDDFLGPKPTIVDLRAKTRWEAIDELAQGLVADGKIKPEHRDAIVNSLRQRESLGSTGIGKGVAIPHATTDLVSDVVVALGQSEQGIQFESVDGKPAHTVVLLLVPRNQFQKHLNTLATVSKLLHSERSR